LVSARADAVHAIRTRAAHQNFVALCKDADPDIGILKQAKAEVATIAGLRW